MEDMTPSGYILSYVCCASRRFLAMLELDGAILQGILRGVRQT